ncbi:glycosyltransferase [Thiohalocapsa marina]|uniref:glycosyltransferase n=1 Tax=Thiohalocapsa marina TaxID=424902 RepID=UPI0036DDF5D4
MPTSVRRQHLLLITTSYPWVADGRESAGSFVADFAEALTDHLDVSVVAPGPADHVEQRGALSVHFFAAARLPLSLLRPWAPADWPIISRTLNAGSHCCRAVAAARPVDHALALWALPSGYWARQLPDGVPYSVWGLGSDIWTLGRIPIVRRLLRRVLRGAGHCFADGLQLGADMERIGGRDCRFLPSARQFPSPHHRRPAATRPPYRLAFLGRWHPNKGVDLLLDALAMLDDTDWQFIKAVRIAGGGPLVPHVGAKVGKLAAADRPVRQEGFLDRAAAAELFDWADFILLPSRIESIPVIFSDAMQARRPLIATPVGDLPQLLADYGAGILAESATAQAIAQAIRHSFTVDAESLQPGLARAAADFDIRQSAADFAALINESAND